MTQANRYVTAMFALSSIAPLAHAAQVVAKIGYVVAPLVARASHVVVPFCAGVARGVADYQKKDPKINLRSIVRDDAVVAAVTTGAHAMQKAPICQKHNELIYDTKVEKGINDKYDIVSYDETQEVGGFSTSEDAIVYLKVLRENATKKWLAARRRFVYHFAAQLVAFPAGYTIGYSIMKLRDRKNVSANVVAKA